MSHQRTGTRHVAPVKKPPLVSFFTLASFVLVGLIAVMIYLVYQPEKIDGVSGYGDGVPATSPVPNLLNRLALKVSSDQEIIFSEKEINHYVERRVSIAQTGALADAATFNGVAVKLLDGRATIIFDRTVWGRRNTVSVDVRASSDGKRWVTEFLGGKLGALNVPGGGVRLVKPSLDALSIVFERELEIISNAGDVRFESGKLIIVRRADN